MKIYDEIKNQLEFNLDLRERRFKDRYLVKMVLKRMGREYMTILPVSELSDFAKYYESYNREWRRVLQDHESLRGRDYDEKKPLEQKTQIDLGYAPMFRQDIKRGKQLSL